MATESNKNRKRTAGPSLIRRIITVIGQVVMVLVLIGLVTMLIAMKQVHDTYRLVRDDLETIADIKELPQGSQATHVYDRHYDAETGEGSLLGTFFDQNREQVDYYDLPPLLLACILSTEDWRFFEHGGVDLVGLGRAAYRIVKRGGAVHGGGSSITQQLSRNVFLPNIMYEKTANRKIQEVILAGAIEKRFTKQEILEAYCNHVSFGGNNCGVKTAAREYFNKDLDQLTLAECALIAGQPQSPTAYYPPLNPEKAKARRDEVLKLLAVHLDDGLLAALADGDPDMFADLRITKSDVAAALATPLELSGSRTSTALKAPYFTQYIRSNILDRNFGSSQVNRQGFTVVTTLDYQYQQWAEEIVKQKIDEYRESKKVSQAAVILLEAATGEVLACVGGYEWLSPQKDGPDMLNRAMLCGRPVGSSFKPFTYSTAYEQGFPVTMTIFDGPNKEISARMGKSWPLNADHTYLGWISIFYALQRSRNAASVDLLVNCTGYDAVIETAHKMGITAELEPVPALTLGVCDIKPIEMAEAFDTFPNMGIHVDSILIKKIYDQQGVLIEANDGVVARRSNRALSENTAWTMVQNMIRVVEAGTGTRARVRGVKLTPDGEAVSVQLGGKTGTNDDFADAWFVGYSPELVCAIWVGNDDYGDQMKRMHGGDMPAEIFAALMKKIYDCQYETIGEGETAQQILVYQPRYTKVKFEKPEGATFNGFPAPVTGSGMTRDEEGNWVLNEIPGEEGEENEEETGNGDEGQSGDDNGFYEQWEPPAEHDVYW
ncbi:transglycosylase domain-containing protein [bacterium]|nr:transglycosylase domain-containing protein [bacterium]